MRIKIEIKNFDWMVKLKRKIILPKGTKRKQAKEWGLNWKNNISKTKIEWWNWKKIKNQNNKDRIGNPNKSEDK
jgi:hypothetical protein